MDDLFSVPSDASESVRHLYVDYRPLAAPHKNSPIEFYIPGNSPLYVDLRRTRLATKWHIEEADGTALETTDTVAAINLAHHTMWEDIQLSLQHKQIHSCGPLYAYKAYVETLLTSGVDCKETQLSSEFWFSDTPASFNRLKTQADTPVPTSNEDKTDDESPVPSIEKSTDLNEGFIDREKLTHGGLACDTEGPLHLDICQQTRPIINGVDIHIKLWPSKPSFSLMSGDELKKYEIVIDEIYLRVCKVEMKKSVLDKNESHIRRTMAKYPMQRTVMKAYNIAAGLSSFTVENPYQGSIPNKLLVFMVRGSAVDGSYTDNPLYFRHTYMNNIAFYVEGESVPAPPQRPEFGLGSQIYTSSYDALFTLLGQERCDFGNGLTHTAYSRGYTIFAFDVAGHNKMKQPDGHSRIELHFKKKLVKAMTMFTYAVFPSVLEIDKDRQVHES